MSLAIYVFIFSAKLIEMTLFTFRTIMLTRGKHSLAGFIGFFEVLIAIIALGKVMTSLNDVIGVLIYCTGFAVGNFVGSKLEEKIGMGLLKVQIIVEEEYEKLVDLIRDNGYGVTSVDGRGKDSNKQVLIVMLKRKELNRLNKVIFENKIPAVVTVQDVKKMHGGFMGIGRRKLKFI